jgi:hypothetical protein
MVSRYPAARVLSEPREARKGMFPGLSARPLDKDQASG